MDWDVAEHARIRRSLRCEGDGTIVVGVNSGEAFLWNGTVGKKITDWLGFTPAGWTLTDARAVSDDGKTIAGNGNHGGRSEGWVAHLN